jgi:hypothetical protein
MLRYTSQVNGYEDVWGESRHNSIHYEHRHYMGVSGQPHVPAPVPPEKGFLHPLHKKLCGPQRRPGLLEKGKFSCPLGDQKPGSCSPQTSHYTDLPDFWSMDGIYFSRKISGCVSMPWQASSASLGSVLRMTEKHSEFSDSTNIVYVNCAPVRMVEYSLLLMTCLDHTSAPPYASVKYIGTILPGRWTIRKLKVTFILLASVVRKWLK